ncbi:ABC transporter permease [Ilumatobacter coccineus]|uniref:Transport permease protein n=1 Tax=Ilumatobacter coccineus (strain NBRC 103263 / KCTC 29153 / YM16-304) TaxID=1313172 RepID=A0A6C7EBE3_ILUCY|nr:ABC transporter permease [Ilumatobacter coccineus]BAN03322.1 putative polysaccharide ABC transporter permease protein [Ilumatobacter coccineus YM16-304]
MAATSPVGVPELRDAHESDRLGPYLRDVIRRRSYIWYVAKQELRSRQVLNVLGNLWHLLNPLLSITVYFLIFGLLLKTTRGVDNFLMFLTIGLFVFQFTQKATTDGAKSIVSNKGLLKGVRFPRAILPITSTVTELLSSLSTFAMMYVILLIGGTTARWTWILFPVLVGVQFVFNLGAAMVAARMTTHFRDTTQLLPFFFRLLLYASGVIYNVDAYVENNPTVALLFKLNPMYCFLTIARWTLLGGSLDGSLVVSALAWSILLCSLGFIWFRAAESSYARD